MALGFELLTSRCFIVGIVSHYHLKIERLIYYLRVRQ